MATYARLIACRTVVAVAALLALAACARRYDEPPPKAPPGPSVAERVQVLNADVFVIDGRHVHLAGAVAPQPIPDARCWAEALAAKQATAATRDLVRSGHDVRVEPIGGTDAYGRVIARVYIDHQDLASALHDMGLIAETDPGRFHWCDPVSAGGEGAPDFKSLMDFSRG